MKPDIVTTIDFQRLNWTESVPPLDTPGLSAMDQAVQLAIGTAILEDLLQMSVSHLATSLIQPILLGLLPTLAGHICEVCLDAPAILLAPAPWGGQMGVCWNCAIRKDDA